MIFRLSLILFATMSLSIAGPLEPLPLWPDGAPGEADLKLPDEMVELKGEHQIEIMSNVSTPTLTMYPAKDGNGASVLVCPGGGYNILAYSHEGKEVCEWLNSIGVSAALLKYRVPRREGLEKHHAPLQDAQRAISMMRSNAKERNLDPKRIGILGFSAGGHLATMCLTSDGTRTYPTDEKIDGVSCIPDFAILVYPAYLKNEKNENALSPEIQVSKNTPPAFLVVAHGDRKFVEGSALFYLAMRRAERDAELHIFNKGGHGFGLENTDELISEWSALAGDWMGAMGFLKK